MLKGTKLYAFLLGVKESMERAGVGMSYEDLGMVNAYDSGRNLGDSIYAFFNPQSLTKFIVIYDACNMKCIEALDYTHAEVKARRLSKEVPAWIVETDDICAALEDYLNHCLPKGKHFTVTEGP